jgi:transcriptional regulator with XRE-family HTH domain
MDNLQITVATEIRRIRLEMKIDQNTLARISGVKRSTISNIESKRQSTTLDLFYRLSSSLSKNPGDLLNAIIEKASSQHSISSEDVNHDNDIFNAVESTLKKGSES